MSYKVSSAAEAVTRYVNEQMTRETALQTRLRAETAKLPEADMQISPHQGSVLSMLVRLAGTRRAIEIGTFTGYSALTIASALPSDGSLLCCDVSDTWTKIAQRYWQEAGISDRIELRLGPALKTLDDLLNRGQAEAFDFAFIDADKAAYDAYYERILRLLRSGGVMVLDNMLRGGDVTDSDIHEPGTDAIRTLNAKICTDARVDSTLLTVGDGFMVVRKR